MKQNDSPVQWGRARASGIAPRVEEAAQSLLGTGLPVGFRAWDGSRSGPQDGPCVVVRSPRAIRHLLRSRDQLGLARAYIADDLDIEGDFVDGLRRCLNFAATLRASGMRPKAAAWPALAGMAMRLGMAGPPPPRPAEEIRVRGRLHSRARDKAAIAHHYDLGNDFYESVLDPTMTYSCGYWTSDDPGHPLTKAQTAKLDLICRKLALAPGARLLDVGCGWGSLILYAAETYGVRATGVTVSERQHEFITAGIDERGLGALVEVRLQDYREVRDGPYDAIASVEMGEHVGDANYPEYCAMLHRSLRPRGRLLLQQMSRGHEPGGGAFIETYIAPDMTMRPLPRTLEYLEKAGLEIREISSLREHYVRTIEAWWQELDRTWQEVVERFGTSRARIWRLYLAGGALSFEAGRMSVHQILAVRTGSDGSSGIPACGDDSGVSWTAATGDRR